MNVRDTYNVIVTARGEHIVHFNANSFRSSCVSTIIYDAHSQTNKIYCSAIHIKWLSKSCKGLKYMQDIIAPHKYSVGLHQHRLPAPSANNNIYIWIYIYSFTAAKLLINACTVFTASQSINFECSHTNDQFSTNASYLM